jgi:hypothetical protein
VAREHPADEPTADAVLTASRALIAVTTRSLGAAAGETTLAQYLALVVLAARGQLRMAGLAEPDLALLRSACTSLLQAGVLC